MSRIDVAIGIIIKDGRILICQRQSHDALGDFWEFPGGKCEPGEKPEKCVVREILEEVGLKVGVIEKLDTIEHEYPHGHILLHPFVCRRETGEAKALTSQKILWVKPVELWNYEFPPANDSLLVQIIQRFH